MSKFAVVIFFVIPVISCVYMARLFLIIGLLFSGTLLFAEECKPCEAQAAPDKYDFKGVSLALLGGFGLSNPNATFSTFPGGTKVDYRTTTEAAATLTYHWEKSRGVTFGIGTAIRNLAFKDGSGSGNYPINFIDLRAGYRSQISLLLFEAGLLYGFKTQDAPITIDAYGGTVSGYVPGIRQNSFLAAYFLTGIRYPFNQNISGLFFGRLDYGLTAAISGSFSGQEISLIPFSLTLHGGIGFKL
ncbi:MAG: hypothetical protein KF713_04260 [Turneriella sp.]|nr:hypothetical protein [Turneriella sp.]